MKHENIKLTRCEMQTEALIIEELLSATMAMQGGVKLNHRQEAFELVEMAFRRAKRLSIALDSVNMKDAMQ